MESFIQVVLANDENRRPFLPFSKRTALRIGLQIESLANALDARDIPTLGTMASRLRAVASELDITPIAEVAARIEQSITDNPNWPELMQYTIDLLELCRSAYSSYLPRRADANLLNTEGEVECVSPSKILESVR